MNIVIFCQLGVSSLIFAKKLQEKIDKEKQDSHINAYAIHLLEKNYTSADIVLITPAVTIMPTFKRSLEKMKEMYPNIKVIYVKAEQYFNFDVDEIYDDIKRL